MGMILNTIVLLLVLGYGSVVNGAPIVNSINGPVLHDRTFTVMGGGFATGPVVYKWDNFEGDTHIVGQKIGAGPAGQIAWEIFLPNEPTTYTNPKIANVDNRHGSTKFVRSVLGDKDVPPGKDVSIFQWVSGEATPHIYLTHYQRWSKDEGTESQRNEKFWRIAKSGWAATTNPYIRYVSNIDSERFLYVYDYVTDPAVSNPGIRHDVLVPSANQWTRIEIYAEESTNDVADGLVHFNQQTTTDGAFTEDNLNNIKTRSSGNSWHSVIYENYLEVRNNGTVKYTHDYDDIYIANSRARVEIGNAPTWKACTHREIQIPAQWSDNSITVTTNEGSFQECNRYYLYVVDKDGNVNADGYMIYLGGSQCPSPPLNPTVN